MTVQEQIGFHGVLLALVSRNGRLCLQDFLRNNAPTENDEPLSDRLLVHDYVDPMIFTLDDLWDEEEKEVFRSSDHLTLNNLGLLTLAKLIQNTCETTDNEINPSWWDDVPLDISPHSDVRRLINLHRVLYNADQTDMTKEDFQTHWDSLVAVLVRLLPSVDETKYEIIYDRCLSLDSISGYFQLLGDFENVVFATEEVEDEAVRGDLVEEDEEDEEEEEISPEEEVKPLPEKLDAEVDEDIVKQVEGLVVCKDAIDGLIFSSAINVHKAQPVFPEDADNLDLAMWQMGRLRRECKLGAGGFGKVYLYRDMATNMPVAVKKDTSSYSKDRRKYLINEIQLMRRLKHERIVKYYGGIEEKRKVLLLMEYVHHGSISDLIKHKGPLPEYIVKKYVVQILEGLVYLHSQLVIHRDIKAGNVLLTERDDVKLTDFGLAWQLREVADKTRGRAGTLCFMAPEVVRGMMYGTKADIWSVGCTAVEMLTSAPPWVEFAKDSEELAYKVANFIPKVPGRTTPWMRNVLKKLFVLRPDLRPTARQLLVDDVFKKVF